MSLQNVRTNKDYRGVVRTIGSDERLSVPSEFWKRAGLKNGDKIEFLLSAQNEIIIFDAAHHNEARYFRKGYIGIERRVGHKISIPAEFRRVIGLSAGVDVEIFLTTQKEIIVKLYK